MKVILTNDDGIDGPGLKALEMIFQQFSTPVVVAPQDAQSGVGHRVTTHSPITVNHLQENRISIGGTPADCARLALKEFAPDAEWLVAGINPGANLGSDVYQSGTLAAAREAAILGYRSIAISQYIARDQEIDWDITRFHATRVLDMLLQKDTVAGQYWNVNLPHPIDYHSQLDFTFCSLDKNPHRYGYRREGNNYLYNGTIHERMRDTGNDVAVCFGGQVSITLLSI